MSKKRVLGLFLALISAIGYGAYAIFSKHLIEFELTNNTILFLRFSCSSIIIWIVSFFIKSDNKTKLSDAIKLLCIGGIIYALMSTCTIQSIRLLPASLSVFLICTYPVFVAIFSVLLKKSKLTMQLVVSLAVCIFGLALSLDLRGVSAGFIAVLVGIAGAVLFAIYIILGSIVDESINPARRVALIMSGAAISYTLTGLFNHSISFDFEKGAWIHVACLVIFSTVIPVLLFWIAVSLAGAVDTSIVAVFEPIATAILSVIFLGDTVTPIQVVGFILTAGGIILAQIPISYFLRKSTE